MDENRFFKLVWRFNGLILMIAGLLSIILLIFAGYMFIKEKTKNKDVSNVINIEKNIEKKFQLGYITNIYGASSVMVSLNSEQNYPQAYFSKSTSSICNYLFINTKDNTQHWLFDNNKSFILNTNSLPAYNYDEDKVSAKAIMYTVIKQDTNKDNKLTANDLKTIALSLPNGTGYKEIVDNIDKFIGQSPIDDNNTLIIYQKKGVDFSAIVNLSNFTTIETVIK